MSLEKATIDKTQIDKSDIGRDIILKCANCHEYIEAKENYRFNGSANEVAHTVSINCDCGYNETFSKGLGKE